MANLIQIKRSLNTANPTGLANGEFAYTANGDVLFIGSNGSVVAIAGLRNPGTLTANQALVANSTSGIDKIIVANAAITKIYANGSFGTANQVLTSNGTVSYWSSPAASVTGSDTQVQFNDAGTLNATSGFTFTKSTDTVAVANTVTAVNVLATGTVNAASFTSGANVVANNTTIFVGNSTVNTNITAGQVTVNGQVLASNTYLTTNYATNSTVYSTFAQNTSVYSTFAQNTSVYSTFAQNTAVYSTFAQNTSVAQLGSNNTFTANQNWQGTNNYFSSGYAIGGNVVANTSALSVGNSTVNTVITAGSVTVNGNVLATNSYLTTNYATNSTVYSTFAQNTSVYSTFAQNTSVYSTFAQNTSVYSTFAQNTAVYTNFAQLAANNSFTGNNTLGGTTTTVSSNLNVTGFVANNLYPTANTTYNIGNNTLRFNEGHFLNVHSVSGYFDGSVTISGNLTVAGNVTTTNVSSVVISDPLIYLAGNNYTSDAVDIGFVGNYKPDASERHTGLFRRAADDSYYLFKGLTQELQNVTTVNVADPTFVLADLRAYLLSGALVSNAAAVTITANSTVNVNITANTLTLSTALAATSGGSGQSSYTAGDILTASNSSYLSKLSLGTSGYVLQSNGTALVYGTLDGGSF